MTHAEEIAKRFHDDGSRYLDDEGIPLFEACEWAGAKQIGGDQCTRLQFQDGSAIVACDGGWDLAYRSCDCWQGGGHDEECPNSDADE